MAWPDWRRTVGGQVTHEGTLLCTRRGVFEAGIMGSFYLGQKRDDGSVEVDPDDWTTVDSESQGPWIAETETILEYADPPGGYRRGCHRLPAGAIECHCHEVDD